jgi:hypothetical protein
MAAAINWTPELETEIVDWISGGKTLREFGRQDGKPSHDAVYDYQKKNEAFRQRIAHAREIGEDVIAEESLEIVDELPTMEISGEGWSKTCIDPAGVQRNRIRAEHRLKLLAKWNPKKYGERVQNVHTDAEGGPVQFVTRSILDAKE